MTIENELNRIANALERVISSGIELGYTPEDTAVQVTAAPIGEAGLAQPAAPRKAAAKKATPNRAVAAGPTEPAPLEDALDRQAIITELKDLGARVSEKAGTTVLHKQLLRERQRVHVVADAAPVSAAPLVNPPPTASTPNNLAPVIAKLKKFCDIYGQDKGLAILYALKAKKVSDLDDTGLAKLAQGIATETQKLEGSNNSADADDAGSMFL